MAGASAAGKRARAHPLGRCAHTSGLLLSACSPERHPVPHPPNPSTLEKKTPRQAFTIAIASLVHPVLVHWVWAHDSWLSRVSACRPLDFAGGTVVHMIGGVFGIVGAVFVGPRLGRFEDGQAKDMPGHDMGWVTIGTLCLW